MWSAAPLAPLLSSSSNSSKRQAMLRRATMSPGRPPSPLCTSTASSQGLTGLAASGATAATATKIASHPGPPLLQGYSSSSSSSTCTGSRSGPRTRMSSRTGATTQTPAPCQMSSCSARQRAMLALCSAAKLPARRACRTQCSGQSRPRLVALDQAPQLAAVVAGHAAGALFQTTCSNSSSSSSSRSTQSTTMRHSDHAYAEADLPRKSVMSKWTVMVVFACSQAWCIKHLNCMCLLVQNHRLAISCLAVRPLYSFLN
mmetsp:Transcript_12263/g.32325  ORF Transcript_12263/g.32325 Transcript_12263/m.32325 type:complete len:258 (-) Transcript_12263:72-845(-)